MEAAVIGEVDGVGSRKYSETLMTAMMATTPTKERGTWKRLQCWERWTVEGRYYNKRRPGGQRRREDGPLGGRTEGKNAWEK